MGSYVPTAIVNTDRLFYDSSDGEDSVAFPVGLYPNRPCKTKANLLALMALYPAIKRIKFKGILEVDSNFSYYYIEGFSPYGYQPSSYVSPAYHDPPDYAFFKNCKLGGGAFWGDSWPTLYVEKCTLASVGAAPYPVSIFGRDVEWNSGAYLAYSEIDDVWVPEQKILTVYDDETVYLSNVKGGEIRIAYIGGSTELYLYCAHGCEITVLSSCDAGYIEINGSARVTDQSTGTCTVVDNTIEGTKT